MVRGKLSYTDEVPWDNLGVRVWRESGDCRLLCWG